MKAKKVRREKTEVQIDLRIDLHGMTQDEAFKALKICVRESVKRKYRNMLVITGKSGVLKETASRWITYNTESFYGVVKVKNAPKHLGADGAFIVVFDKQIA